MNHVVLRGRLTDNPKVHVQEGENKTTIANFTLAVADRTHKNKDGDFDVDFIRMTAYNIIADNIRKYTAKGAEILAEGKLHTYSYKNKEDKIIYVSEVIVERLEFLSDCKRDSSTEGEDNNKASSRRIYIKKGKSK